MAKFKIDMQALQPYILPAVIVGGGVYIVSKLTGSGGQTPAEIDTDGLEVKKSDLKRPLAAYKSAAENSYRIMNQDVIPDNQALIDLVKGMNASELREVYKAYGKRAGMIGLPLVSSIKIGNEKDIFAWYTLTLHNNILQGKYLDKMKAIWKPSGLWT